MEKTTKEYTSMPLLVEVKHRLDLVKVLYGYRTTSDLVDEMLKEKLAKLKREGVKPKTL